MDQGTTSVARSVLGRLGLLALGVLLGLIVLEAGLQAGAVWMRLGGQTLPSSWVSGNRRVLCLGDSNTYGLYLEDRAKAYPQQLELLWNTVMPTNRIEVLNLGYPGTNSSRLRRDLPHMLEVLRPDVVVVLVGANDCWTAPVPIGEPQGLVTRLGRFVQRHSRLYQLAYMLGRASSANGVEIRNERADKNGGSGTIRFGAAEFSMGFEKGPYRADFGADLERNLAAIVELTQGVGAQLVLLTYPSEEWNYGDANRHIRVAAERTGTPLVDTAPVLKPACPREPCPAYLYRDHHPTAQGYGLMALALMRRLLETNLAPASAKPQH